MNGGRQPHPPRRTGRLTRSCSTSRTPYGWLWITIDSRQVGRLEAARVQSVIDTLPPLRLAPLERECHRGLGFVLVRVPRSRERYRDAPSMLVPAVNSLARREGQRPDPLIPNAHSRSCLVLVTHRGPGISASALGCPRALTVGLARDQDCEWAGTETGCRQRCFAPTGAVDDLVLYDSRSCTWDARSYRDRRRARIHDPMSPAISGES